MKWLKRLLGVKQTLREIREAKEAIWQAVSYGEAIVRHNKISAATVTELLSRIKVALDEIEDVIARVV